MRGPGEQGTAYREGGWAPREGAPPPLGRAHAPRLAVLMALFGTAVAAAGVAGGNREPAPAPPRAESQETAPAPAATPSDANAPPPRTLVDSGDGGSDLGVAEGFRDEMTDLGFELPKRSVEAIDFELIDPEGMHHKLSAYRGSIVFLNFWATWCVPCRTEMPAMQAVHDILLAEETPFRMVAINMQEAPAAVRAFVDELGLSFDILIDETGKTGATYAARTLPISYVIGKDGAILARIIGIREWADPVYVDLFQRLAAI